MCLFPVSCMRDECVSFRSRKSPKTRLWPGKGGRSVFGIFNSRPGLRAVCLGCQRQRWSDTQPCGLCPGSSFCVAPSLALRVGCWWRRKAHGVRRTLLVGRTATPFSLDLTSAPLSSWDSVLIFDSWFPKGPFSLAISVASASSSTALSMWHVFSRFLSSSSPGIVF